MTLRAVFDKASLAADFRVTLSLMLSALVVFFIMFIVLSYFLARYLTQPITALSHIMAHSREKHRIMESPYLNRTDEIGTLYNQYRTMLEENNHYIKSEYENKMILMDTQMKALESQINAHFLYNTLEAINSLAEIEGSEDISTMALALGPCLDVDEAERLITEIVDPDRATSDTRAPAGSPHAPSLRPHAKDAEPVLTFDHVEFSYPHGGAAVHDLNLTLYPGELV